MATPLELIRDGIRSRKWQLVLRGYQRLTGEKLVLPPGPDAPPEPEVREADESAEPTPPSRDEEIARRHRELRGDPRKFQVEATAPPDDPEHRRGRTVPATARPNQFRDDRTLAADDIALDKALSGNRRPVPRDRPAVEDPLVVTRCDRCGDTFESMQSELRARLDRDETTSAICPGCVRKAIRARREA
jgi:hypothetical protein